MAPLESCLPSRNSAPSTALIFSACIKEIVPIGNLALALEHLVYSLGKIVGNVVWHH